MRHPSQRYRRDRHIVTALVICLSLMIASLLVSRTIAEIQSRRIQQEAETIGQDALEATEGLIAARTNLHKLVLAMDALNSSSTPPPDLIAHLTRELEVSRGELATNWAHYLSVPFYPGEQKLAEEVEPDLLGAEHAVDEIVARLRGGDRAAAIRVIDGRAVPSAARSDAGLGRILELNRNEAQMAATRITATSRLRGLFPEVLGVLFAVAAAYFGVRVVVRYLQWSAERSAELEYFAGRVAHDIRSPLGSVSLTLAIVEKSKDIDSRTRGLLVRVGRTMEHVKQLIDDLLVFASAGGYIVPGEGAERKASVRDVLDGVVEDCFLEAESKGIDLMYDRPESSLEVGCGPGVLISVVTNLVSNAMKFIGDAPVRRVTVSARQTKSHVRLEVSDTGPGLAPELCERVFQPHVRGTSKSSGFGLGLATVRRLVEAHGGTVGVEASPEAGCSFWVCLPLWNETQEARRWPLSHAPRAAQGG
jgi:signal transduction histidine kinase